jgi:hypothetical protein
MSPANYAIFVKQVKNFMADDSSADGRPDHMVAQQATLADAYIAIHDAVNSAKNDQIDASKKASDVLDEIEEKLRWFQLTLPTLTPGDDSILYQFGLQKSIPVKKAEIRDMGDSVNEQWQEVRGQALYAPIRAEGDKLADLLTEHETQEDIQIAMAQEYSQRQEEREVARREHHVIERAIFNWYRGLHQDPYESWWTNTPWGRAGGGGEEPPALEWPDWPGPVEASAEQIDEGLVRITYSGLNGGKTLRIDRLKQGDADYVLVTDGLPLDDPEEVMPFDDDHLDKKKYTYKLTPFDEAMEAGLPALVEVTVR